MLFIEDSIYHIILSLENNKNVGKQMYNFTYAHLKLD